MPDTVEGELAVELCMRSSAPSVARGRQQQILDRIEALQSEGHIEETTVNYWSSRVCSPDPGAGSPMDSCPRVVGEILAAADCPGVSIKPYFRERPASHDPDEDVLFLPVICLLVRRAGELRGIYPLTVDGESYTVEDGIARLTAEDPVENLPAAAQTSQSD